MIARAVQEQLSEAASATEAARRVVEMLAVQSKAALVSIQIPMQILAEPIWEAGYGSGWAGSAEDGDLCEYERDEIVLREGTLHLARINFYYRGVPRADGDRVNDRALAEYMLSQIATRMREELKNRTQLTKTEIDVARLLNLKNREIAQELRLSKETIRVHIKNINRKLGASTREEVVAIVKKKADRGDGLCSSNDGGPQSRWTISSGTPRTPSSSPRNLP